MEWRSSGEVQVPWACILVNDEFQSIHISDVPDSLTERRKYRYVCYGCGDRLIAHKRKQKADSFIHEAAPHCPLTSADGSEAIHLNALLHLKHFLDKSVACEALLSVAIPCPRCVESQVRRVSRSPVPLLTLQLGDRVVMHQRGVGTHQPDIRILRGSQILQVLDIFAQQPCMDAIWASRDTFGAPVVEVNAHDILGLQSGPREPWTSRLPLLAHRTRRLALPECNATHSVPPPPVSTSPIRPFPPDQESWPLVPTTPLPPVAHTSPTSSSRLLVGLIEFHLNFFVRNHWRRAFYCLLWVTEGDGGHGELRQLDSNASVPSPKELINRYEDWLSGDLLKAAARADVAKLKERFRVEQGGHDFTLKEIPLNDP